MRNFREENTSKAIMDLSVVGIVPSAIRPWAGVKRSWERHAHSFRAGIRFGHLTKEPRMRQPLCKVFQNLWNNSLYVFRSLRFVDTNQRDGKDRFTGGKKTVNFKDRARCNYAKDIPPCYWFSRSLLYSSPSWDPNRFPSIVSIVLQKTKKIAHLCFSRDWRKLIKIWAVFNSR